MFKRILLSLSMITLLSSSLNYAQEHRTYTTYPSVSLAVGMATLALLAKPSDSTQDILKTCLTALGTSFIAYCPSLIITAIEEQNQTFEEIFLGY